LFILITNAGYFVCAKLLGGKGNFKEQFYLSALLQSPIILISPLYLIPCVGLLIAVVTGLYYFALQIMALKEAHEFSGIRAAASYFLPPLIAGIIFILFVFATSGFDIKNVSSALYCPGLKTISCTKSAEMNVKQLRIYMQNKADYKMDIKEVTVPEFDSCEVQYVKANGVLQPVFPGNEFSVLCTNPNVQLSPSFSEFDSDITIVYIDPEGNEHRETSSLNVPNVKPDWS
jgi:hypothetical protein